MLGVAQIQLTHPQYGFFHGIKGIGLARQHGVFGNFVESFREITGLGQRKKLGAVGQPGDSHLVLGEGAGFIRAQDCGRAEGFDGGRLPGQDIAF